MLRIADELCIGSVTDFHFSDDSYNWKGIAQSGGWMDPLKINEDQYFVKDESYKKLG